MQLEVRNLSVAIHRKPIVSDVSLTVGDGEFVGMLGPNGCVHNTASDIPSEQEILWPDSVGWPR